jgi:putative peptidoglycan lipid II flippase
MVNTILATGEAEGSVSALNYAFRLMYLPIGLFGVSIATAVLPAVSRHVTADDETSARGTIADGLSLMLMLNLPATVGLMVLATPIVRLIFERGEFGPGATAATASALQFYALGLIGYSIVRIASPTFYALGQSRIPVIVSILTMGINAGLNVVLVRQMGADGLALGTSIAALFNAVTLFVLLRRRLGGMHEARLAGSLVRIAIASAAMGSAAYVTDRLLASMQPGAAVAIQIVHVAATIGIALVVLAAASWLLRIDEFSRGMALLSRRLRR